MGIKRWLLLLAAGIACLSLGFAYLFRELYPLPAFFYYATLQFIPRWLRAGLLCITGGAAIVLALFGFNRAMLAPFVGKNVGAVTDALYYYRQRERGPRVVAIGGGHGLSVLLRGLKHYTSNITAIVTVADDGGSSGRLRRELGVLPPGDFRNCIAALASDEQLMTHLFQYRFGNGNSLGGHSFGNLFITAMAEVTGSFERALIESGRVLMVHGRVLPSTLRDVTLMADMRASSSPSADVNRVTGESRITKAEGLIERVYLSPADVPAYPEAVRALLEADLIVAGPGSLYTSILPNLLVPDIAQAVRASQAIKVYVCNIATQRGETDGYGASDHVAALAAHVGKDLFSHVLVDGGRGHGGGDGLPPGVMPVQADFPPDAPYCVVTADLVDPERPWRHDSHKLACTLLQILSQTKGVKQ